jgi:putative PIN family toxin of toxin-antitoxin system
MNVILDTNVVVSGIFFKGPPFEILTAWKKNKFSLVTTHEILDEYKIVVETLAEQFAGIDVTEILEIITLNSHISFSVALPNKVCADPEDDKFIAAALASKTKLIVSGDKHLLNVSGYAGIDVIKPGDFLRTYLK